ncbi:hypothetical protein T11_8325 [Trichinella zimbabwensis]|uniref:Uncharacterized protein n=1 Tax=Trichinella zimbabwensis TaxID=268475 RepID=A0A0V1H279_9BILA|nr:hypothetical protein T11_8325 [Trichinella zimbabwensis]
MGGGGGRPNHPPSSTVLPALFYCSHVCCPVHSKSKAERGKLSLKDILTCLIEPQMLRSCDVVRSRENARLDFIQSVITLYARLDPTVMSCQLLDWKQQLSSPE